MMRYWMTEQKTLAQTQLRSEQLKLRYELARVLEEHIRGNDSTYPRFQEFVTKLDKLVEDARRTDFNTA